MFDKVNSTPFFKYLSENGEMAGYIQSFDWSQTNLKGIDSWPQSLITTLGIMLNAKSPMLLFWGEDLVQFYNDAFRPILGENGKHPAALGQKGKECWAENWDLLAPMMDQIMQGGEPIWLENQLIPLFRNKQFEDVYWTFGLSKVLDEEFKIAGIFVICTDTTEEVRSKAMLDHSYEIQNTLNEEVGVMNEDLRNSNTSLEERNEQLQQAQQILEDTITELEVTEKRLKFIISDAPVAIGVLRGTDFVVETANVMILEAWGKSNTVIGQPLIKAIPELEGQKFIGILNDVYNTGVTYYGDEEQVYLLRNGQKELVYFNFVYQPVKDANGATTSILIVASTVTEQVVLRKDLEFTLDAAKLGTWNYNAITDTITGSERFFSWFKFSKETGFGLDGLISLIAEEDRERTIKEINKVTEKGSNGDFAVLYSIVDPVTNERKVINAKARAMFDPNGFAYMFLGTAQDLTEEYQVYSQLEEHFTGPTLTLEERRVANFEKLRNLIILHQTEQIAKVGSWEYDISSKTLTWSDGMYQIFNLKKGTVVNADVYATFTADHKSKELRKFEQYLSNPEGDFEIILEFLVDQSVKVVKINASLIGSKDKKSFKILGLDMDITEQVTLQKEKELLEAAQEKLVAEQNQQLFWTSLNAQEQERKRISESLFNGLGQSLYAIKLSLDQLNFYKGDMDPKWFAYKKNADDLLVSSIKESRRISHELSSTILNDFGLKAALNDLCSELKDNLKIDCQYKGLEQIQSKDIQSAVYRTVQELYLEIVKSGHAHASVLNIEIKNEEVKLDVQNFGTDAGSAYLNSPGLKLLETKIKLLNGKFKTHVQPSTRTSIDILIPLHLIKQKFN
jgi:signal transduction histidine kinase